MIVSQHWLKDYVDIDATVSDLADMLSLLGLEAEVHTEIQPMSHVVIGKVKSAEKHPNADKLKLCQVFDGKKTYWI